MTGAHSSDGIGARVDRPMRVLYHHRTASKDGQEVHIKELVGAMRRAGHTVQVISPGGDDDGASRADGASPAGEGSTQGEMGGSRGGLARLRALVPDALMPLAARAYEALFVRRLVTTGRAMGADFLYERHALDNRVGTRASRALGIPLVLEVNSPLAREEAAVGRVKDLDKALRREMETIRSADVVLAVTEALKAILVADGADPARVHVIQNGATAAQIDRPRSGEVRAELGLGDALVLGFVGFPRPWHGLDRVVRAMAGEDSALRDAILLIGGEGPALAPLLQLADELAVRDRIRPVGVLNRDRITAFVDAFDIALQPHATDYASPLKLFEYLARGVCVVAPDQPNLREVVTDGESAVLFRPGDDASFAQALCRAAEDPALRVRVGAGGRQRLIDGGFTWTGNGERVIEIARGLVGDDVADAASSARAGHRGGAR